ncbi:MAG TPA: helix-turn-helix domain-containing protein [Streptosporangiaceae bacterium]|nr:helix-turn-helix domain-containing protein [Streptosporangiaceae bacterium]
MADDDTLGDRLRTKRRESSLTQEELAHISGVSQVMIVKIEQGRRQPRLPVLFELANALDIPLSELIDQRPRLDGHREGASILAIRAALLSPSLLPGVNLDDDHGEPAPLPQLRAAVSEAARQYWAGEFANLAAILPALIGEARLTAQSAGPPASSLLAHAYDLAASLMVHMGKADLAAVGAERAIAAAASNDELLHAILHGTYAWVLLHQGRLAESERLAVTIAQRTEPTFSAPATQVAAWGNLLMTALAPAAAGDSDFEAYISLASAAAERIGTPTKTYLGQSPFSRASVAVQACHAYAVIREPAKALAAARKIDPGDLSGIAYGRHLLDVAQAHNARHPQNRRRRSHASTIPLASLVPSPGHRPLTGNRPLRPAQAHPARPAKPGSLSRPALVRAVPPPPEMTPALIPAVPGSIRRVRRQLLFVDSPFCGYTNPGSGSRLPAISPHNSEASKIGPAIQNERRSEPRAREHSRQTAVPLADPG